MDGGDSHHPHFTDEEAEAKGGSEAALISGAP